MLDWLRYPVSLFGSLFVSKMGSRLSASHFLFAFLAKIYDMEKTKHRKNIPVLKGVEPSASGQPHVRPDTLRHKKHFLDFIYRLF